MSMWPSELKSPATMEIGVVPVARVPACNVNVPSPLPLKISTLFLLLSATARSRWPSALKSAAAIAAGAVPAAVVNGEPAAAVNVVPLPLPSQTLIVLSVLLATAKSRLPSPLKSPCHDGRRPIAYSDPGRSHVGKGAGTVALQDDYSVSTGRGA